MEFPGDLTIKAKIVTIGTVDGNEPRGWTFDGLGRIPALAITPRGLLYGGYTIDELREIAKSQPPTIKPE